MKKTELMIVGVTHLGRCGQPDPRAALQPVIQRITSWAPDAFAAEVMPGEVIAGLTSSTRSTTRLRAGGYADAITCRQVAGSDLDLHAAQRIAQDQQAATADRVVAWCAAYEPYNALLVCRAKPHAVKGLPPGLAESLETLRNRGHEAWLVAGAAALQLGHPRLHLFDDHTQRAEPDEMPTGDHAAMMSAAREVVAAHPHLRSNPVAEAEAIASGDLWQYWSTLNSPGRVEQVQRLETRLWLDLAQEHSMARRKLAGWHSRNLLMAAHLRGITGAHPGGRIVAVVGHSHKGALQAALRDEHSDLRIVQTDVLG